MDELLYKSLTASGGGAVLTERDLSAVLVEAALMKMPLLQLLNLHRANGTPYRFKRRDMFPAAQAEGSGAGNSASASQYSETDTPLKIIRSWGGVENFVQETVANWDSLAEEVLGSTMSVLYELTGMAIWGDANANPYAFSGFDAGLVSLNANSLGAQTMIQRQDGAGAALPKATLDNLLDNSMLGGTLQNEHMLLMSAQMVSRLGQLEPSQDGGGLRYFPATEIWPNVQAGLRITSYRNVPIFQTDLTRPTAAAAALSVVSDYTGGGSAPAGVCFYRVAPVTRFGEQGASPIAAASLSLHDQAILTPAIFKASTTYPYGEAEYWKIYRGAVADGSDMILVNVAPGYTYDVTGKQNGANLSLVDNFVPPVRGGCLGTAAAGFEDKPLHYAAGAVDETIWYINRDPDAGCELVASRNDTAEGLLDDLQLVAFRRLGDVRDQLDYMVRCYCALGIKRANVHGVLRRVRAS